MHETTKLFLIVARFFKIQLVKLSWLVKTLDFVTSQGALYRIVMCFGPLLTKTTGNDEDRESGKSFSGQCFNSP